MTTQKTILLKEVSDAITAKGKGYKRVKDENGVKYSCFDQLYFQYLIQGATVNATIEEKNNYFNLIAVSKPSSVEKFEASLDSNTIQDRIQKNVEEKRENIKWLNAVNNATLLVSNGVIPVDGEGAVATVERIAKLIYGIKPPVTAQ
jgi:hypothetical protein